MRRVQILSALLLIAVSCLRGPELPEPAGTPILQDVSIMLSGDGLPAVDTRSSVTASEDGIRSAVVFFYMDGELQDGLTRNLSYSGSGVSTGRCTVELQAGKTYEVLAVANAIPGKLPTSLSAAISQLEYSTNGISEWNSQGLPMSGRSRVCITPTTTRVEIPMVRLVAKVNFTINTSRLKHGKIRFTSMSVRQMNTICPFFSEGKAAGVTCAGDMASESDLVRINSSDGTYSSYFYLLENLQGDILAGNIDPDSKVPEKVRSAGYNPDNCTYFELTGTYEGSSGTVRSESLTARLFLGRDATANFDIVRNGQYYIELTFTDEGCLRTDWKIDGRLQDSRVLKFVPESASLSPGENETVELVTNLSHASGDYSYAFSGDLMCFSVSSGADGKTFGVSIHDGAPEGASLRIDALTWDGALATSHELSVKSPVSGNYETSWAVGGGVLYLAQRAELVILDRRTGKYPEGRVTVSGTTGAADVSHPGGQQWYVDAVALGEDELCVKVDGTEAVRIPFLAVAPLLRFDSEKIFLPIDGSVIDCGPYYYRTDGRLLAYSDFVPELYEELLDVSIERYMERGMYGRGWRPATSGGNPAVSCINLEDTHTCFGFYLSKLSYGGLSISENYDFASGQIGLERLTAYPNDRECGVLPATAELYTSEPFSGSRHLGERSSWALARWYRQSTHDEKYSFRLDGMVLRGNDYSSARGVYPFSSENKYSFSYPDNNTVEMTILYSDNVETAMPEHYFTFAPAMRNRHSGEVFVSDYRYSVDFTVNLAVGGVAADNGAGGCDVSVEWAFPRLDDGRLRYLEENAVGGISESGKRLKGMYSRLYTVYGYSREYLTQTSSPGFGFIDLTSSLGAFDVPGNNSYHVPEEYGAGYDLVIWKYGALYPDTGGWLWK